jgi:hypothetical protein
VKVHDMTKRVLSRLFLAACLTIVGWAARAAQPPDVAAHCTAMKQVRSLTADGLRISNVNASKSRFLSTAGMANISRADVAVRAERPSCSGVTSH